MNHDDPKIKIYKALGKDTQGVQALGLGEFLEYRNTTRPSTKLVLKYYLKYW